MTAALLLERQRMQRLGPVLALCSLLLALVRPTACHPSLFVGGIANSCTQQPDHLYSNHGNPQTDLTTSIILTDSSNQTVTTATALCPGGTYHLNITWGVRVPRREFLVTSTYGTFSAANPDLDAANCANRFYSNDDQVVSAAVSDLVLPCMGAMQDGDLQIFVTSVISSTDYYRQTSASYTLDTNCMAGACAPAPPPVVAPPAPVSPPSSGPAPSSSPTAPSPSVPPVQHTCTTSWPEARLPELCQLNGTSNVSQAAACTIYRQCTGTVDRPLPRLCNVTRIYASLCMEFPTAVPECAMAQALAGGDLSTCMGAMTFSLPSTPTLVSSVLQMCSDPFTMGMDGCTNCSSVDSCPDPLSAVSNVCLYMQLDQCGDWNLFCSSDGAVSNNFGVAAPGLCLTDDQRANAAAQYAPPPLTPSSPCITAPQDAACASYTLPDAQATAAVQSLCGSISAQLPACSVWSACTAGNLTGDICSPFGVMAALCNSAPGAMACQTYQSLCVADNSAVEQCTQVEPALTSLISEASVLTSLRSSCWAASSPSSRVDCYNCTSANSCVDPFSALTMVCGSSTSGTTCAAWQTWCNAYAAAAPWFCLAQVYAQRSAAVSAILAAVPSPLPPSQPPPPQQPLPSPQLQPQPQPQQQPQPQPQSQAQPPPPSGPYCTTSWPEARLTELCQLSGPSNAVQQSSACTIYRQCTGAAYPPQAQLCNVTRIFGDLCIQQPAAIPECAIAQTRAGGDLTTCFGSSTFNLPSTSQLVSDVRQMCSDPTMSGMAGCGDCPSSSNCPDPLISLSKACIEMGMAQCSAWTEFCGTDGAVTADGQTVSGAAAPSLCIADTAQADNAAQYASPPPSPSSPCISGPQDASCTSYTLPDAESTAAVQSLCGSISAQLPTCSVWSACLAGNLSGSVCSPFNIMAALCNGSSSAMACQTYQSLCKTSGSVVQQCTQVPAALTSLVSESSINTSLSTACWAAAGPSSPVNCYTCTSANTCADPLSALSMVCGGGAGGSTCTDWQTWCSTAAQAAPWFCSAQMYAQRAAAVSAALGRPSTPVPVTSSPSSSSPPAASPPLSTDASPAQSPIPTTPTPASPPSSTAPNCVRTPTLASCADYMYPDASATQDITSMCRSMPGMTGCSIWATCKAQAGASGIFCSPFTLLATMCIDMPTMNTCASYKSLCNTTGSVVRQCKSQAGIPDALGTTNTLNMVVSICSEMSMTDCDQCVQPFTTAACPDPFFTVSSLCTTMPTMSQCSAYFNMCAGAATLAQSNAASGGNTSSLSRYCDGSAFTAGSMAGSALLSRMYLPAMLNYFHQRTEEVVLWTEWIPHTAGQYAGTIIAIILFGVMSVLLKSVRSALSLKWASQESARAAQQGPPGALRSKQEAIGTGGGGDQGGIGPGHVGLRVMTDLEMHLAGRWWWLCTGRQLWQSLIKSFLFGCSIALDYLNMLVVMTFNIGFFVAVVGGYLLGSLLCTPVLENYSARLQQRKGQRSLLPTFHATLYAADAAAAAAAAKDVQLEVQPDSSAGSPEGDTNKPGFVMVQPDEEEGACCCGTESENPVCCP